MKRRSPNVRGIRIMRAVRIDGTYATKPADDPPTYWSESRRDWIRDDGTHYPSIGAAQTAIKRFRLAEAAVVC